MSKNAILPNIKDLFEKNGSDILTGIGIAGMITSTVLAVKATPAAYNRISDVEEELEGTDRLNNLDKIKIVWPLYIPSVITGALGVASILCGKRMDNSRSAALAAVYSLSERNLREYQEKLVETLGEDKAKEFKRSISKDRVDKHPVESSAIISTKHGKYLCYDTMSGRYFESDMNAIKTAVNELNKRLLCEMSISLNDFYYELDLPSTKMGDEVGWNIDKGLLEVEYNTHMSETGIPCLAIDYSVVPKFSYY